MLVSLFFPLSGWLYLAIIFCWIPAKIKVLKDQLATISTDRSVQVLLITWGFGGYWKEWPATGLRSPSRQPYSCNAGIFARCSPYSWASSLTVNPRHSGPSNRETVLMEETGCRYLNCVRLPFNNYILFIFLIPITLAILADRCRQALLKNILLGTLVRGVSFLAQYAGHISGPEMPAILGGICSIIIIIGVSKWTEKVTQFHETLALPRQIYQAWSVTALSFSLYYWLFLQFQGNEFIAFCRSFIGTNTGITTSRQFTLLGNSRTNPQYHYYGYRLGQYIRTKYPAWCNYWPTHSLHLREVLRFLVPSSREIGTFITGSGTSANILFGSCKQESPQTWTLLLLGLPPPTPQALLPGKLSLPSIILPPLRMSITGPEGESKTGFPICSRVRNTTGNYCLSRVIRKQPSINQYL